MIDFTIKTETTEIQQALTHFISQYKLNITEYINQYVAHYSQKQIDSSISIEGEDVKFTAFTQDKGVVMGEVEGTIPVKLMPYTEVEEGKKYMVFERDKLALFLKTGIKEVDVRLGMFSSLAEAIKEWNSDAVKAEEERVENLKKVKAKEDNRLRRLGKLPIEAEEAQIVETQAVEVNE